MADPLRNARARKAALASGLALLLGGIEVIGATPAQAQAQQSGVIGSITVQGNERIDSETILSYLPLNVGDTVNPAKIDTALKALLSHRSFFGCEDQSDRLATGR